jgi:hypothetical protein
MSASETQIGKELYEFGSFRVDPAKQLLLHDGESVPLTPKAFQLLLVLVRHCNEIVTKDELMKSVWPDTFVENCAAGNQKSHRNGSDGKHNGCGHQDPCPSLCFPDLNLHLRVTGGHDREFGFGDQAHALGKTISPAGHGNDEAILLYLPQGFSQGKDIARQVSLFAETDTVVLADFTNSTSDPVFDGTLRQGMEVQLEQSPFLSLVPALPRSAEGLQCWLTDSCCTWRFGSSAILPARHGD